MQKIANRKDQAEADKLLSDLESKFPNHKFVTKPDAGADQRIGVWVERVGGPDFSAMRQLAQGVEPSGEETDNPVDQPAVTPPTATPIQSTGGDDGDDDE